MSRRKKPTVRARKTSTDDPAAVRSPKARAFLAALAETGNITAAAQAAGVGRRSHYLWMEDPAYRAKYEEAMDTAVDALEREARRRAIEGVVEPVFYKGKAVGAVRRYSDTLAIFLLKAARPEKYRDRHEFTGKVSLSWEDMLRKIDADDEAA